jgi:tetratricopeptide (TPR) repeat protein
MVPRHRRFSLAVLIVLLTLAAPLAPVIAQDWAGKGRLQGDVLDPAGKPVQGAKVTLRPGAPPVDPAKSGPAPVTTDKRGHWAFLGLTGGAWGVLIEKEGFVRSEGQAQVNEFGPVPPIRVTIEPIPEQVQKQVETNATGEEALAALKQGNAKLEAGQYAEARAEYEKALAKLEPANHPPVLRGIARTYYEEKQLDKAIDTLKKALEIKPDDVESQKLLANLYVDLGIQAYNGKDPAKAEGNFSTAIENDATLADAYYYRGLARMAQGKNADAKADFQKLLELDPNHPQAADAREFLKSL